MRPHPEKAQRGGEDAFVTEGSWMGVADGVGGWAGEGIDSGMYSRELMGHCGIGCKQQRETGPQGRQYKGPGISNGPCGCITCTQQTWETWVHHSSSSEPMQHSFNFPFQVGTFGDHPTVAEEFKIPVCKGDIIVLGTDGLFDNLFNNDIVEVLKKSDQVNLKVNSRC
ncbi:probable protein phosphatase 2C 55 [Selaginella moellendorffii]|uniref:probable protein phosphatase 2C 55 n=1 Tax=Selaginella moellendorffii TaxID=88036 RepID=UPI000D1C406F|nr:probable protein phosphatase 2C 55 [Selaginella moellendorffii]|eukprot:XP_024520772.1 probable protein phosphatase 2C 55 [Selaginella moellendorffii]